jgi:hypothetical protein
MFKSKLSKVIVSLLRRVLGVTRSGAKRLMRAMLRSLMAMGRRARLPVAGFVLPTVTMVLLVVILLTVAITLRSFDRGNIARNVRVNQQVLAAATPALDRAKAKIQFMLREDPQRPTATPSDNEMYRMMSAPLVSTAQDIYTFGGEERLTLKYDLNGKNGIEFDPAKPNAEKDERINTAWKYAVDTDNNGKVDTYTLYAIFFRSPERQTTSPGAGSFIRARLPLEARTPPMTGKIADPKCAAAVGTSASLVGDSGWYKSEGKLKKSFFVYTVNLPITKPNPAKTDEEAFKGTPSFSALEYQQDQIRIPLSNNAVVYEDDLEMSAGVDFSINGRIFTNSNLFATTAKTLKLYQVSSPKSCFYDQENSKIIVGGNVVNAGVLTGAKDVNVDLFKQGGPPTENKILGSSTSTDRLDVLYNNQAYSERRSKLVDDWIASNPPSSYPIAADPLSVQLLTQGPDFVTSRRRALEGYFNARLRKVPFGDTTSNPSPIREGSGDTLRPATEWNLLKKADKAIEVKDLTGPPGITLVNLPAVNPTLDLEDEKLLGDRIQVGNNLPQQRWDDTSTPPKFIGLEPPQKIVGSTWQDENGGNTTEERTRTPRVTELADVGSTDRAGFWEVAAAEAPKTPVDGVGGLRVVTGGGVYERLNSFLPPPGWDNPRTTAIENSKTYDDPATAGNIETYPIVWPDTMPMSPVLGVQKVYNNVVGVDNWDPIPAAATSAALPAAAAGTIDPNTRKYAKGDLRMRATAVYHYANNAYDPTKPDPGQTPIACISSYYDPSTSSTARNFGTLPDVSGDFLPGTSTLAGMRDPLIGSNNGVVYGPPTTARPATASVKNATTGLLGSGSPSPLETQANYVFPNGRFANEPLRKALLKAPAGRTLADNAAIDATICAFGILGTPGFNLGAKPTIADGAIKEVAFLDGRNIKAVDRNDSNTIVDETFTLSSPLIPLSNPPEAKPAKLSGNYDLALEERQPLEIRTTVLDIEELRKTKIPMAASIPGPSPEYWLPNSGIIYATRDDALPDRSDRKETSPGSGVFDENTSKSVSPTDSRLDPTRRPNGIMLIKGVKLFRGGATPAPIKSVEELVKEKGLTLVSNLPVYIKGEFNKHTQQEFTDSGSFYARSNLNESFACRQGDPRLPNCTGDDWRPATVLGDAVTILSGNFREGFRNEGDFDLRNNAGGATFATSAIPGFPATQLRRNQGFYNNNFVTNGLSSGAFNADGVLDGAGTKLMDTDYRTINGDGLNSSYFNNFVTPIQRRGEYPEYLMEVCTKLPVSACKEDDWFVDPTGAGVKAKATLTQAYDFPGTHKAGTTAQPPIPTLQRFPRRVAFQRDATNNTLENATSATKVTALGISASGGGTIAAFDTDSSTGGPRTQPNSLWFASAASSTPPLDFGITKRLFFLNGVNLPNANDGFQFTDGLQQPPKFLTASNLNLQPLLMPVLQIHATDSVPTAGVLQEGKIVELTKWLLPTPASPDIQEFNLILGSGDVPSRKILSAATSTGEFNGGLQNLPRFIENWRDGAVTTKIIGSFIQLNRSAYSTAPFLPRLANSLPRSAFCPTTVATCSLATGWYPDSYKTSNGSGSLPFFSPPGRNWGFDVGILSQPPDLFTQRFTAPSTQTKPAEFFREVPRNDPWVETLMCAFDKNGTTPVVSSDLRPTKSFCEKKTGG